MLGSAAVIAQTVEEGKSEARYVENAQALVAADKLTEADQVLSEAVRLYPRSGGIYNLIGIVSAQRNRDREAETAFLQAVKLSPALVPAYLNLARVQYGEGKPAAAAETYRRALRLNGNLEEAHANLGALLLSDGKYMEAVRQFAALPKRVREQNRFRALECAALAGSGDLQQAFRTAEELRDPLTEPDVSLAAVTLARFGQKELVITLVEPVLKSSASKELRGLLATAYAQSGRLAEARAIFDSILREEPTQQQALIDAARVAYRQGDFEASAAYLLRTLETDKTNAQLQFFFGIVCIQLNLPGDALGALKEAVRLDPKNPSFNYALGAAILSSGNYGNAAFYFRRYIQLRPGDSHGRLALGIAEFQAGDSGSARRDLTVLTHDPSVAAGAHYILGKLCRQEEDYDGARGHFLQALKIDPYNADLEANMAIVDIRQNKLAQAKEELDRALVIEPGNYLANENLLLLLRREKDPAADQQAQKFAAVTQRVSDEQKLLLRHIDIQHQNNN